MKKVFTILLLLLYLALNVGVNILVHTCSGESEALLVTSEAKDPCVCGDEMPMEDMCCTTELKTVKLDDSQKTVAEPTVEKLTVLTLLFVETASVTLFQEPGFRIQALLSFSPPPDKDYQSSHSVFLI